jgi:chromosome segregation protein
MRLKRLELYGCKSFASRSVFEFGEGITAIVGPNGSGKSNIADAVRWVMGEQGFSSLRAKSTEDMIFAGSRSRARLGMAEVIITFDNTGSWLPVEFGEVAVGRRAYRSGENEYLLNGNRVRYRDVLGLLGGAGLMRSTYTVIGQGMVDAALSLRPESRRTLFEEAAGIAPHLRKRADALRRIEETERNLERVTDILNELRPRALSLRKQAERAEEHRQLGRDLQERQRLWYGYQWQRRLRLAAQADDLFREGEARLGAQRAAVRALQEKQERAAASHVAQQQMLEALSAEQGALRERLETDRRDLAVSTERMRLYGQQRAALAGEMQPLASRRGILESEVEHTQTELAEQEGQLSAGEGLLDSLRAQLAELDASRQQLAIELTGEERRLAQVLSALADARSRAERLGERHGELCAERDRASQTLQSITEQLVSLRAQGEQFAERERAIETSLAEGQERRLALGAALAKARDQLAVAEASTAAARATRDRLLTRRDTLAQLRQELSGYYPGVREVLAARLPGLLGTVAQLLQVPPHLEQAIESALGPRLQNIVAEHWDDAEAAIAHLKRSRGGWATFLPLDTIRARSPLSLRSEPGVVGVASRLVTFDEHVRPAAELLLGSIIVVQDLTTARGLLERRMGASLLVTLSGDTVQPSGALSGGTRKEAVGLLAQEREWRSLPQQLDQAESELSEALRLCAALRSQLDDLAKDGGEAERELERLRAEREAAHAVVAGNAHQATDLERERAWQQARLGSAESDLIVTSERLRGLRADLAAMEADEAATMARANALHERQASTEGEELRRKAAELETRRAVTQRTAESLRRLLDSHQSNLRQVADEFAQKQARQEALGAEMQQLAEATAVIAAKLAETERAIADVRQRREPLAQELARLERERQELERQHTQGLARLNEMEVESNHLALERDRAKDDLTVLVHDIEGDLGPVIAPEGVTQQLRLDLGDRVVELPPVAALPQGMGEEIQQLKTRLRRLGDINFAAPQEYAQLTQRQAFLDEQAADLRNAITALREVIHELDQVIDRDFALAVQTADKSFAEHFSRLFNGGTARLVLTDPENLSTTGVDIIAHPPGKRAQNLSLLSGGERALTGVALLFALLRANPVPFCILDEVDAALDEANVRRFRELLQECARGTQFVVITHNRHTIEAASTIYGIAMSEQGVSQSISLKLDNREGQLRALEPGIGAD